MEVVIAALLLCGAGAQDAKKIVLIAGTKSHGPGDHEYEKGVRLLQRSLELSGFRSEVHLDGWPADEKTLEDAATILVFSDGSDRDEKAHPLLRGERLKTLAKLMDRGVGLVALHYTVFVPQKRGGEQFLEWLGGYFDYESGPKPRGWYSKIKTCKATVTPATPDHPISRGLKPYELREEFYYNMRFRPDDTRRVPILTVPIPGEAEAQTVAWAVERKDGGRGFAFTGGHFHDNWQVENFRKMVLNAIVWTAKLDVPADGVASEIRELDLRKGWAEADANDVYGRPPIKVECRAKLNSKTGFNVLVANEPKYSATHWEIYSYAGTGAFSAYLPGYEPSEIKSTRDITDGAWHHVAMSFDGAKVRLTVDEEQVAEVDVKPRAGMERHAGPLTVGLAVDRTNRVRCDGFVSEVRISNALVIGRWRLDAEGPKTRVDAMDYGPVLGATVGVRPKNIAHKGLAIRVRKDPPAYVCFDTDLMRMSVGWTGGFLAFNPGRDGLAGHPWIEGKPAFGTSPMPGWSRDGSFKDPRERPFGPLPREWAKYRGLYLHGETVILSYTVGSCDVLESPGFEMRGATPVFTRTFRVGPSAEPLTLLVCDARETPVGVAGTRLEISRDSRVEFKLPPRAEPVTFRVSIGDPGGGLAELPDLAALCKGGPARWSETITTRVIPGKETGAYVVDTLTEPEPNPWKSWMRFGGLDFFSDGRAAVTTVSGDVWIVSGIDEKLVWKRFATGLFHPLGLRIVDDAVYTLGRDQITRLHDLNGDGEADFYENFNNDCEVTDSGHEYALDLQTDAAGNFYYIKGDLTGSRGKHHGCLLRVSRDGRTLEIVAAGLRQANGLGIGPAGEITCGDNQGEWTPSSRLNWVRPGGFYGYVPAAHRTPPPADYDRPLCWIPHEVDRSCGSQVWVPGDAWGPFKGRLLSTSYGHCAIYLVFTEEVEGRMQGGVYKFPLLFSSGVMRARFNPKDGQLYVCGMRGWDTQAVRDGGLYRVRYTGKPVCAPSGIRTERAGVRVSFTDPLDPAAASDAENYAVEAWNYAWTAKYGSPKFSVADPKRQGTDRWEVKSAKLLEDGRTVFLEIPELKPVMQLKISWRLRAADGAPLAQEIHTTVHVLK